MLIFLDVETTGIEDNDKICSIGIISDSDGIIESKYELINENKKISPKASSVNHLTNEMLIGKVHLAGSEIYAFLNEHNDASTIIIGHNIHFDMKKLSNEGFIFKGSLIDTLRVTKHLVRECESYALQVLRYELKLYRSEEKELMQCGIENKVMPHNAISDALVVKLLFTYL